MKSLLLVAALALSLLCPAQADLKEQLQPLGFLVGSCWSGKFENGAVDTHCFEPMLGGHFIRDRHEVTGGKAVYAGETVYSWDAKRHAIAYTYWASDGGVATGDVMTSKDGELEFPGSYTADGKEVQLKSVWKRTGVDSYDVWSGQKVNGEWKEMWHMTMQRAAPEKTPAR